MANLSKRNLLLRTIASSGMHPIHLEAPEMKRSVFYGFLFLGPLVELQELWCTHFKLGCYQKEVSQVPNMGDRLAYEIFLATDFQMGGQMFL